MTGGEIAAGRGQRFQIAARGKLRRVVGRMIRRLSRNRSRHGQHGEGDCGDRPAIETNGKHQGSPWLSGIYGSIYNRFSMRTRGAASSRVTMPRLALNRKDTGGYSIGSKARWPPRSPENACSVAVSWPGGVPAHAIVVTSPHNSVHPHPPAEPR